ncbi:SAM-dependent methyltransferase [Brooklawnia cerclae]|uniref:S-adenosyl-L-methionine-dependent methyltransferase n=1 Tax=Brooklawnia cerclae TaxID=349934 RepID=A0ABX0SFM0_9ACTN|nr:methyltransferase (TIGR00027 family) [Brooklawnia cerclae]
MRDITGFSTTAVFAAAARAAHPIVDQEPHLLEDPVAQRLCESISPSPLTFQVEHSEEPVLAAARLSACARSNFADRTLLNLGIDQLVVVGAGLDTTLQRLHDQFDGQAWLVDLPGVLAWREELFRDAGVADFAHHVAADLRDGLDPHLLKMAGFKARRPAVVLWLGVSMYLLPAQCRRFFADLSGLSYGSVLIFDYVLSSGHRDEAGAAYANTVATMAGKVGEPWLCTTTPSDARHWLEEAGWYTHQDVDEASVAPPEFWDRQIHLKPMKLIRLVYASLRVERRPT